MRSIEPREPTVSYSGALPLIAGNLSDLVVTSFQQWTGQLKQALCSPWDSSTIAFPFIFETRCPV
ncbi:MAG: hypothetical protein DRO05_08510 [Thermoproteota archaeon]|nr:MAG: hypothetical protein DRO05_08510 [Candidatus Korarchaeota archaeon]